ncbi:MAG: stage II sporulation protein M [Firmicutes bacterium]|nr:stage II sporulation protein M [Bacillota bacterium]
MRGFREALFQYFRENLGIYFFVTLTYALGIGFGAFSVSALGAAQKAELAEYLRVFFQELDRIGGLQANLVVQRAVFSHLKIGLIIWFLGITVVGAPLILVLLFLKGFILGFTVGFVVHEMSFPGLLFAVVGILPHNVILVPALLMMGTSGISFSLMLIRHRLNPRRGGGGYQQFLGYSFLCLLISILFVLGGLVESYIVPVFIRLISPAVAG